MTEAQEPSLRPTPIAGHLVGRWFSLVALILAISGNVAAASFCTSLNMMQEGSTVSVKKILISIYVAEAVTLLLVLPLVGYGLWRSRFGAAAVVLGIFAVGFAVTPLPAGKWMLDYVLERNNLIRKEATLTGVRSQPFESPSAISENRPA